MENNPTYYHELIVKYFSGEISGEETGKLSDWLASAAENRDLFNELRKTWILAEQSKAGSLLDVDAEWDIFKKRIAESGPAPLSSQQLAVSSRNSETGGPSGNSLLPDAERYDRPVFNLKPLLRIAAVFFLIAVPSFLLIKYFGRPEKKIISSGEQVVDARLPDGTSVTLNKGTTIEFPENFKGTQREVKLSGEAFFSVKHDSRSRFIISNGNVRIEDVGTSFYVNTNSTGGRTEVVLAEGQVSVYFREKPEARVILTPGERADIDPEEKNILRTLNGDENYMAWKTMKLVFNNSSLDEVVELLNKVYQSDIRLSGKNTDNCRLSATFDKQSLESVLNVIQSTLDITIISRGPYIEISGNKCE